MCASAITVLAVAHVVVDKFHDALTLNDSRWAIFAALAAAIAAVASAVAAAATTGLALVTRNLVKKTGDMSSATKDMVAKTALLGAQTAKQAQESALAIEQAQRHHEQSLMPIVWLTLDCDLTSVVASDPPEAAIMVTGHVVNSGPGPATSVYLHLKASFYIPRYALYLGLIGPNATRPFKFVLSRGQLNQALEHFPYDCVTAYETIFDTRGAIVQRSPSGRSKDAVVTRYIPPSDESTGEIEEYLSANHFPTQTYQ
jgi:hypothetical protein